MKGIRSILILLFCCHLSYSQKVFDLTIWCDSTVNPKELRFSYYNGYDDIIVPDTLSVREAILSDKFVSKFVAVNIEYLHNNEFIGSYVFFVNEKKSSIHLSVSGEGSKQKLEYRNCVNTGSILDTNSNTLYKKIFLYRYEEAKDLNDLWSKHGRDVGRNDSFYLINRVLLKRMNNRTLSFFKEYSTNYFSFWYCRNQVIIPALVFFENDKDYLRALKASFVSLFSTQIINSEEGKNLIEKIDKELNPPLREGMLVPPFKLKDIEGKFVQLSDFRNKYVLIDFWASWCPPCRKNNPLLKEIYNDYKAQNFEIVSISVDNNLDNWKTAVLKDQLIWTNLSDYKTGNTGAAFNFNVSWFPHYFLIDPDGKVLLNGGSELGQVKTKQREIFKKN